MSDKTDKNSTMKYLQNVYNDLIDAPSTEFNQGIIGITRQEFWALIQLRREIFKTILKD